MSLMMVGPNRSAGEYFHNIRAGFHCGQNLCDGHTSGHIGDAVSVTKSCRLQIEAGAHHKIRAGENRPTGGLTVQNSSRAQRHFPHCCIYLPTPQSLYVRPAR